MADDFAQDREMLRRERANREKLKGLPGSSISAPAPKSMWGRLVQGIQDSFDDAGEGINGVISRAAVEKVKELDARSQPLIGKETREGRIAEVKKGYVKEIKERRGQRAIRDEADPAWSKDRSFLRNLGHGGSKIVGETVGDASLLDAIPVVGRTVKARLGMAAGINAGADAAIQGAEIGEGLRDEFDPTQFVVSTAAGTGLQGTGEVLAKGARKLVQSLPVKGKVSSPFGQRRAPKAGASSNHGGVDIAAAIGTPVTAPASGTVSKVGRGHAKRGNWVEIEHADGSTSRYLHLAGFNVKPGQTVSKDTVFGRVGATGNVTGPHLHWSVMKNGKPVDPMNHRFEGPEPVGEINLVRGEQPSDFVQAEVNSRLAPEDGPVEVDFQSRNAMDDPITDIQPMDSSHEKFTQTPQEVAPVNDLEELTPIEDFGPAAGKTHKNFTEVPTDDPDGNIFLNYKAGNGETLPIKMGIEPNGTAEISIDQFSTKSNRLGPKEIRTAMNDLMEMYPEIKRFGGYRRSGAGKGRVQEIEPKPRSIWGDESGSFDPSPLVNAVKKFFAKNEEAPEVPEAVRRLTEALDAAKAPSREQKIAFNKQRGQRLGAVSGIYKEGKGEAGARMGHAALAGELKKNDFDFEGIRSQFEQKDLDEFFNMVQTHPQMSMFDKVSATNGLFKLLGADGGKIPAPKELQLLGQVFPDALIKALAKDRTFAQKFWGSVGNALNMPRSIMSSFDLSAPFRQGAPLMHRKEFWGAFMNMFKVMGSDKAYRALIDEIESRPNAGLYKEARLALTDAKGPLAQREEQFMSDWAEKMPGYGRVIKASNRAYVGFLNKLRADTFDTMIRQGKELGIDYLHDDHALRSVARFINNATGRGDLGKLNQAAPVLAGVFFSPRLMASRVNMLNPAWHMSLSPQARKESVKAMLTYGSLITTVLGLAAAGGADVETDPRSSDFAKIKVGDTRYDIAGGFQQYLVLGARLVTSETKKASGNIVPLKPGVGKETRLDVGERFLRTKFSPIASIVADYFDGENVIGEKFEWTKELQESFLPMISQDIRDAIDEYGAEGAYMAAPAIFGVGATTYEQKMSKKKRKEIGLDIEDSLSAEDKAFLSDMKALKDDL